MMLTRFLQATAFVLVNSITFSYATAGTLDLNVNNDAVAGQLSVQPFERPEISVFGGFLYHQDDGKMLDAGFFLSDPIENERDYRPWAKVGLKAVAFKSDASNGDSSGRAIAPGAMLTFFVPNIENLYVDFIGFFAPQVLSFGDSDHYWEATARLTYQLMSTADVYVGYRHIEFSLDNQPSNTDITLDDSLNLGAVFRF